MAGDALIAAGVLLMALLLVRRAPRITATT
jgi:hypothetical protein